MKELHKRALLYGSAVLIVGGLGYAVKTKNTDADFGTLVSGARVQLQMAYGIPAVDKQGHELSARRTMIDDAEQSLATAERLEPGLTAVAEGRGFANMLRGDFAAAAVLYRAAQQCSDCTAEQRDVLAFNEARMLAKAGKSQAALAAFAANAQLLDVRFASHRRLEEAAILRGLGRTEEATARVEQVVGDASTPADVRVQAGQEFVALGLDGKAESAFSGAVAEAPIADYHLALLKLRQGDVDTSMELLGRARKALPAAVGRLLREEADSWSTVAADVRFQQLNGAEPATPGR